jgi:hypothetical protein
MVPHGGPMANGHISISIVPIELDLDTWRID